MQKAIFSSPFAALESAQAGLRLLTRGPQPTADEQQEMADLQAFAATLEPIDTTSFSKYQRLLAYLQAAECGWSVHDPADRLVVFSERLATLRWLHAQLQHDLRLRDLQAAQVQQGLLRALGYAITPRHLELPAGMSVPVWQMIGDPGKAPQVLVVPAYNPGQEEDDILEQRLAALHYAGVPVPPGLADADYASIVSDALFGADHAPRFIVLVGLHEWLLLDRFKWPNSRALRFDWSEILDRKDPRTLQAAAALLHRDSLAPESGVGLMESLDENAHRHAFGVSADLKYAIREAIEALGNEAVRQLR